MAFVIKADRMKTFKEAGWERCSGSIAPRRRLIGWGMIGSCARRPVSPRVSRDGVVGGWSCACLPEEQILENNWAKAYKYHVYGAPVTGLPFFGDTLQRMIDLGTGKEAEALNGVVENSTRGDLINRYQQDGYPRLQNMLNEQAKSVGVTSGEIMEKGSRVSQVHKGAQSSYGDGLNGVDGSTGERG